MENFYNHLFVMLALTLLVSFNAGAQVNRDTANANANRQEAPGGDFIMGNSSVTRLPQVPGMNCGVSTVSFQPGARTRWHAHAGGQVIVITMGTA